MSGYVSTNHFTHFPFFKPNILHSTIAIAFFCPAIQHLGLLSFQETTNSHTDYRCVMALNVSRVTRSCADINLTALEVICSN